MPNSTSNLSSACSTCESTSPPKPLAYLIALSINLAYSSFLDAARMSEGLVVASWGLYLAMAKRTVVSVQIPWVRFPKKPGWSLIPWYSFRRAQGEPWMAWKPYEEEEEELTAKVTYSTNLC